MVYVLMGYGFMGLNMDRGVMLKRVFKKKIW